MSCSVPLWPIPAGRHGTSDLAGVCEFYCGKVVGKLFTAFAWIFNACCFFFMISGFGSTLNQQWDVPLWIGYLIAVALAVGTAVMGLQGIVNIIGKIGPVVVTFLCDRRIPLFPPHPGRYCSNPVWAGGTASGRRHSRLGWPLLRRMLNSPRGSLYGQHWQRADCIQEKVHHYPLYDWCAGYYCHGGYPGPLSSG